MIMTEETRSPGAQPDDGRGTSVGVGAFVDQPRVLHDGRHARAERTQKAVTQGMLDCLEAGDVHPTARHVAERAGVSVRAVFRHFDHLPTLIAAVCELQYDRVLRSLRRVKPTGVVTDRVVAFVVQQARLNERISPVRRGAQRYEPVSTAIARCNERLRQRDRDEISRVFETELAEFPQTERREAIRAMAATSSWSHWEELRRHEHLAAPRARKVLEREILAVLAVV
jgi:TetR/AcrR family transcriptional regulator, regulator of autoinduction and epiphytic fitness